MRIALVFAALALPLLAADPSDAVFWSAKATLDNDKKLDGNIDPASHVAVERLLDSAIVIHRDGNSQAEVHIDLADFVIVRAGEGVVVVGGRMINGKPSGEGELRGDSIEGGKRFPMKTGDQLYVPANVPHQFQVEKGKKFTATIVKITPKK